jgi:hypothetical protein
MEVRVEAAAAAVVVVVVVMVKTMDLLLQCGDLLTKINRGMKVLNQCIIFKGLGKLFRNMGSLRD